MPHINEDCYPANYDWLTQEQQENILREVKEYYDCVANLWRDYQSHKDKDEGEYFRQAWYRAKGIACAIDEFLLNVLNVHVEYGWCGHRDEYFLATYDDAVSENAYYYDIACDAEGDVDECYAGGDYENEYGY